VYGVAISPAHAQHILNMSDTCSSEIVVLITAPDTELASIIARSLVEGGLAACVNIVSNVRSIYRWQGKIEDDHEVLMLAKTRSDLFDALSEQVKALHNYAVPDIIALPVTAGSEDYLEWLRRATGGPQYR